MKYIIRSYFLGLLTFGLFYLTTLLMPFGVKAALTIIVVCCVMFALGVLWESEKHVKDTKELNDIEIKSSFGQASKSVEQEAYNWLKAEDGEIKKSIDKYV